MNKTRLITQFNHLKNNYILGLAALAVFADERSCQILEEGECRFGQYSMQFEQVANSLRNERDHQIVEKEFIKMLMRALIKESFEVVKAHCNESNQMTSFRKEGWYQFARIIRNCLSHDMEFKFSKYDKTLLPVNWRGKAIRANMEGTPIPLTFFGYVEAWELFNDINSCVINVLN